MRPAIPLFVAMSLAVIGCMSISPRGMARLSALDPLAVDPAVLAVEIDLPAWLVLTTGDASLRLGVEDQLDEHFVLAIANGTTSTGTAGRRVFRAAIAPADHARFVRTQNTARSLRAERRIGSMSISITGGCRCVDSDPADSTAHVALRTGASITPLASVDLAATIGAGPLGRLQACTSRCSL